MNSTLPSDVKLQLMAFFVDPTYVLRYLVADMEQKMVWLQKYYDEHAFELERSKVVNWVKIKSDLKNLPGRNVDITTSKSVYFTFCLIRRNFVFTNVQHGMAHVLLGAEYDTYINYLMVKEDAFHLQVFCNALSDRRRAEIFEMLLESVAMSTTEIANNVGLSMTALLYHLDIMMKAGLLSFHNKGRTVFYQVNSYSVERAGVYFINQAKEKGRESDEKVG